MIDLNGRGALGAVAQQVAVGLAIGFSVRLVFAAVELAGEIIGLQMGLNFASFFDPSSNAQISAVARFFLLVLRPPCRCHIRHIKLGIRRPGGCNTEIALARDEQHDFALQARLQLRDGKPDSVIALSRARELAGEIIERLQRRRADPCHLRLLPNARGKTARDHGDAIAPGIPSGRIGTPEDMAGAAVYLASRAGDYVVGSTIVVDGGVTYSR